MTARCYNGSREEDFFSGMGFATSGGLRRVLRFASEMQGWVLDCGQSSSGR